MARGHIRKRGNGYSVVIELPRDPVSGKRRQKWLTARNKTDAETLLADTLSKINRGEWSAPSTKLVSEYLTEWLDTIRASREPGTYQNYATAVRCHLIPGLGNIRLSELTPIQVQGFYADRLATGIGATRVNQLHRILNRALKQAVKWQFIPRNVCEAVDPPKPPRPKTAFWTKEVAHRFLELTADDELHALYVLALTTGMRRSELAGLQWRDVDLERRMLKVEHQIKQTHDGQWTLGRVKTKRSQRAVPLRRQAVEALRRHRRRQSERRLALGPAWLDNDLVFDRGNGGLWVPNSLGMVFIRRVEQLAAHGIPRIRPHDLRHTAASLMLVGGLSLFEVSRILGHSSIQITADLYGHLTTDSLQASIDRLDEPLERAGEG